MKSTIKLPTSVANQLKFPVLAELLQEGSGEIVLFTSHKFGVVIISGKSHKLGHSHGYWKSVTDASIWKILPVGTVISLEQE